MVDGHCAPAPTVGPTGSAPAPVPEPFAISCVDLAVGSGERPVLEGVDLHLPAGSISTVMGAVGSGKTALVDAMLGLEPAHRGSIRIGPYDLATASAEELAELRRKVSVLPACRPGVDLPPVTVRQVLLANLFARHGAVAPATPDPASWVAGAARAEAFPRLVQRAGAWLERLDLAGVADTVPEELSPVELRRLSMAAALSVDAPLYLLDDPDIALDDAHRGAVVEALRDAHRRTGATMVVVTNDLGVMEQVSDRVLVLAGGRVVFQGVPKEALADLRYLRTAAVVPDDDGGLVMVEERAPGGSAGPALRPALDPAPAPDPADDPDAEPGEPGRTTRWPVDIALTAATFALIILLFLLVLSKG